MSPDHPPSVAVRFMLDAEASPGLLPRLLQLQGDRYEYEMSVLIDLAASRYPVVEVPIASVYLDGNSSSHFRPLHDSIRVYSVLLRAWRSR